LLFTLILSLNRIKWGEVYKPTFRPAVFSIDEIIAQVDPFPFVPAIWTDLKLFWGSPQRFNNSIV